MKIKLKDPNEFKKMLIINGLSQSGFARTIEVTPTYMSQIVNEEKFPSPKIAKKMSVELGVEFEEIFFIADV